MAEDLLFSETRMFRNNRSIVKNQSNPPHPQAAIEGAIRLSMDYLPA